jgi:hypothetical protein
MRKLLNYTGSFIKMDFNYKVYGFTFLFLTFAIILNYSFNFEKRYLDIHYQQPIGILYYFLFYALSYYIILVPKLLIHKEKEIIQNRAMWLKTLFLLMLLACAIGFYLYNLWAQHYSRYEEYYISKLGANLRFITVFVIPLFVLWKLIDKKNTPFLYGFTVKNFEVKPYIFLLCCMIPLIVTASFLPEFAKTYPKFKPWFIPGEVFDLSKFQMTSIYEFTYGLNFLSIELFFRGALVIGMVALLGRHAVLPMAVVYCFIHFGKPVAECISSFFGGYLLGIIALYTRSIFGGVLIHLGIAWMMEVVAYTQHYLKN